MMVKGINAFPSLFYSASELERGRLVDLTLSDLTVAYAAAGSEDYFGITTANASEVSEPAASAPDTARYRCTVDPIDRNAQTHFLEMAGACSIGDPIFSTASGKGVTKTYEAIDRVQDSAPGGPTEGDTYIVDADGWSAAHANAVAIRGASAWSYVDVDATTNVGLVVYITSEDQYVQWTGTEWADVSPRLFACQAASASGSIIPVIHVARKDKPSYELDLILDSAAETDNDASVAVTHPKISTSSKILAVVIAAGTAQSIAKVAISSTTATATLSGNGGAGTVVRFFVYKVNNKD